VVALLKRMGMVVLLAVQARANHVPGSAAGRSTPPGKRHANARQRSGKGANVGLLGHVPCPDSWVFQPNKEFVMGKYMLGWLLGVPAIVLVVLYIVFH
jgi:hypothetical protein